LSSLAQIAQGTAELRNSYGTGHGRPGQSTGGLGPRHAHLELDGEDGHARPRHGHDVLQPRHLREHLFGGTGHHLLHVGRRGARERDDDVRHGDVDLRLLLARGHEDGEYAQQQRHQGQERRQPRILEGAGQPAADAQRLRARICAAIARVDAHAHGLPTGGR
jgi:hypothetical protein